MYLLPYSSLRHGDRNPQYSPVARHNRNVAFHITANGDGIVPTPLTLHPRTRLCPYFQSRAWKSQQ